LSILIEKTVKNDFKNKFDPLDELKDKELYEMITLLFFVIAFIATASVFSICDTINGSLLIPRDNKSYGFLRDSSVSHFGRDKAKSEVALFTKKPTG
jgi:hypothetical protein